MSGTRGGETRIGIPRPQGPWIEGRMSMGELDKKGKLNVSRRDFLKTGAAALGAGTAGAEFFAAPSMAVAAAVAATYHTTCPYCSASCGQLIDVDSSGNVLDVYGDHMSPFNDGGLCAKGAGAFQLVTNPRRIGAWAGTHAVNDTFAYDDTYTDGIAYKRIGDGDWWKVSLATAMAEIANGDASGNHDGIIGARDADGAISLANGYNSKGTVFFGSSHLNNEPNWLYRKVIANFGTTDTEHQARI